MMNSYSFGWLNTILLVIILNTGYFIIRSIIAIYQINKEAKEQKGDKPTVL